MLKLAWSKENETTKITPAHETEQILNYEGGKVVRTSGSVLQLAMFIKHAGSKEGDALCTFFWLLRNPVQSCNFYEMLSVYESSGSRRSGTEGQAAPVLG